MKLLFSVLLASLALMSSGRADVAKNFSGKTITIVVPYGTGGSYDKYARVFAKTLVKHIPGNPKAIVQNKTGGNGMIAMNWFANKAPNDGRTLLVPLQQTVVMQLLFPKKARYDAGKFFWLGASNKTNMIATSTKVKTIDQWRSTNAELMVPDVSKFGAAYLAAKVTGGALNLPIRVITGYRTQTEMLKSIESGETNAGFSSHPALMAFVPQWFEGNPPKVNRIAQFGLTRDPDLPNLATVLEMTPAKNKAAVRLASSPAYFGRGLVLPPGTNKEISLALRVAYDKMSSDEEFKALLKKRRLPLIPTKGEDLDATVKQLLSETTPEVLADIRNWLK